MNIEDIPDGLAAVQYATKICEDTLGFPAVQSNLLLIADCIQAVGKKNFRGRTDELKVATYWLHRRLTQALSNGEKITTHWLRNGEYWGVHKPDSDIESTFRACEKCVDGWIDVIKDNVKIGVRSCQCRKDWISRGGKKFAVKTA